MMKSILKFGWMLQIHCYQNDLVSLFLTIEMFFCIITDCSHLHCLHDKGSRDEDISFSLVKTVLEEIPSKIFTLEPV